MNINFSSLMSQRTSVAQTNQQCANEQQCQSNSNLWIRKFLRLVSRNKPENKLVYRSHNSTRKKPSVPKYMCQWDCFTRNWQWSLLFHCTLDFTNYKKEWRFWRKKRAIEFEISSNFLDEPWLFYSHRFNSRIANYTTNEYLVIRK